MQPQPPQQQPYNAQYRQPQYNQQQPGYYPPQPQKTTGLWWKIPLGIVVGLLAGGGAICMLL